MGALRRIVIGPDLVLSEPRGVDADAVTAACQDPAIQEWTTIPVPYTGSDAVSFLASVARGWADGSMATWAIREPGTLVGMIGLAIEPPGSAELGYWLSRAARGRGLMARAVGAVVGHAFDRSGLDLDRLSWQAFSGNVASLRVARRAGFAVEGHVRGHGIQRGRRRDAWIGTLLRDDPRPAGPFVASAGGPVAPQWAP